jgi:hypothetical protein
VSKGVHTGEYLTLFGGLGGGGRGGVWKREGKNGENVKEEGRKRKVRRKRTKNTRKCKDKNGKNDVKKERERGNIYIFRGAFRIRNIYFCADPYPDFTDPDPAPIQIIAIFNKSNFFKHYITHKMFS